MADGPLTVFPNLKGCTDSTATAVNLAAGTNSGSDGPLTNLWNLRVRADANGYLLVAQK